MAFSFLLCTSSSKKPNPEKEQVEHAGDNWNFSSTIKVKGNEIRTGSHDKAVEAFSLESVVVAMRRRNVAGIPVAASVQMKLTSLPVKVSTAIQTDECLEMTDGCHAMTDGYHTMTQECYDESSLSPVEFSRVRPDQTSSSCCSCPECLLSLPTSDLGLEEAADCDLFVFEDDFDRLSEAEYQLDDEVDDDDDQFINLCSEETSRYLQEMSGSKKRPRDLCLELPPLFSPAVSGKIASGIRQDSVDMALIETGSNHNDSGIGRTTDESVKADDSSEQEMLENYFQPYRLHHNSDGRLSSIVLGDFPPDTTMLLKDVDANRKGTSSFCQDLGELNQDFEQMHLHCLAASYAESNQRRDAIVGQAENQQSGKFLPPPKQRIVPRMGTRRDFCRQAPVVNAITQQGPFPLPLPESLANENEVIWVRNTDVQATPEKNSFLNMIATYQLPSVISSDGLRGSEKNDLTSAYNTGDSCCSTPVLPQKVVPPPFASEQKHPFPDGLPLSATPRKPRSSDVDCGAVPNRTNVASQTVDCKQVSEAIPEACRLRSLQKLYTQYVDVMYTNRANLEHTIMVQQKLFSQQIQLNALKRDNGTESKSTEAQQVANRIPVSSPVERDHTEDQNPMEWVVKRRSDGSRYIARRPVRKQILKDRAQRLAEERSGVTTDDDAASEMKLGRYWSRDKRKLHLEKARSHRQQKELLQRQKMETVRENDDQPNIIELSRRKAMRHKSKRLLDGFTTIQELLAHGNAESFGRSSNPLLSVTTV